MNVKNGEYWRVRGEQDRAQNRGYRKPHGIFSALITWTIAGLRKERQDNEAYHLGWTYTTDRNTSKTRQ
jgi:hypothetical protein